MIYLGLAIAIFGLGYAAGAFSQAYFCNRAHHASTKLTKIFE